MWRRGGGTGVVGASEADGRLVATRWRTGGGAANENIKAGR